jgi:hypothetical protein
VQRRDLRRCLGDHTLAERGNLVFRNTLRNRLLRLTVWSLLAFAALEAVQAQTLTVLHNFTGGVDGANPFGALT